MTAHNLFNYSTGESVNKSMISNKASLRTIELFAGVGGFRIGLERELQI